MNVPIEAVSDGNRLFGEQNQNIYQAGRDFLIPSTVGMTKFYRGWNNLYRRLTRNGCFKVGMELDYSSFDGSIDFPSFEIVMNLRYSNFVSELQTLELRRRLSNYYRLMMETAVLMETGDLVRKRSGNPSGQVNTITDNSMVNELRWYYAWAIIMPREYWTYSMFRQHVELIVCGDDSLLSLSDEIVPLFTPEKILVVFTACGWAPKFVSNQVLPIHVLQYCSCYFRWVDGHVVPVPSNSEKLIASLVYGGKKRDVRETLTRLLAIRMDSFYLPKLRSLLESFISELFRDHYSTLCIPPKEGEYSYDDLKSLYRNVSQMEFLYLSNDDGSYVRRRGPIKYFSSDHLKDVRVSL